LLSYILKLIQKIRRNKIDRVELPSELNMSLSFIESGCLATLLNNKTAFVLKGSQSEIELLRKTEQILFGFECIKRPEFPSVRMYFELRGGENKPYQFDYFFGIESDEDIRLLSKLKDQDYFDILFFNSVIRYSKRVNITQEERKRIKSVLDKTSKSDPSGRAY
jgi:hypothetical protein